MCDEFENWEDRLAAQVPSMIPDPLFFEPYNQNEEPFENFTDRLGAFFAARDVSPKLRARSLISSLKVDLHTMLTNSLFPRQCANLSYKELKSKLSDLLNPKNDIISSRSKLLNRKQERGDYTSHIATSQEELGYNVAQTQDDTHLKAVSRNRDSKKSIDLKKGTTVQVAITYRVRIPRAILMCLSKAVGPISFLLVFLELRHRLGVQ